MAMNFWEAQRQARSKTFWYVLLFLILTLAAATTAELALRYFAQDDYQPPLPYLGLFFMAVIFLTAGFNYVNFLQSGGKYVAESMNGRIVYRDTPDFKEQQLLNIVEEIAVASSLPVPPVYILDAKEINAFAAGTSPDNAVIAVTRGTMNLLSRDELQGVLAHEFSHIYNADVKISMRLAAMIAGFFIVSYLGFRLLQGASFRRRSDDQKGADPIALAALIMIIAGAFTWFFGSILQASVSRQREFLADASAVQFTRNPYGIMGALKKIANYDPNDMPKVGRAYEHLYFNEHPNLLQRLFATHPPLEERIAVLQAEAKEMRDNNS